MLYSCEGFTKEKVDKGECLMSDELKLYYIKSYGLILIIIVAAILLIRYVRKREVGCTCDVIVTIKTTVIRPRGRRCRYVPIYKFTYKGEEYESQGIYRYSSTTKKLPEGKEYIIKVNPNNPNNILDKITWSEYFYLNRDIMVYFIVMVAMFLIPFVVGLISILCK
jgi:hypothetical protein